MEVKLYLGFKKIDSAPRTEASGAATLRLYELFEAASHTVVSAFFIFSYKQSISLV